MHNWKIAKQFDFCYGHRVWSQKLKEGFATNLSCACRHYHGHQGKIIIYLSSNTLTDGMVTDFKHLGWFKQWLDDTLDHKFIFDVNDPILPFEVAHIFDKDKNLRKEYLIYYPNEDYYTLNLSNPFIEELTELEPALMEKYEGLVLVNFVPTSENLSKWIYDVVDKKMSPLNIKVERIQFYETPKSQANYYNE